LENQNNALRPGQKIGQNDKYHQIINLYKIWIDAEGGETRFGLEPGKYINDLALKQYYLKKETQRRANKQTAKNTIRALNKLCRYEGTCSLQESGAWETIETVLETLQKKADDRAQEKVYDIAATNPTKIISIVDLSRILLKDLNQANGKWHEICLVWVVLSATLVRWRNGSVLTLEHLYVYKDLPPHGTRTPHDFCDWEDNDDKGWIMSFLIPPHLQIKKNNSITERRTELVGAYRHKRAERCCAGILAFFLFEKANAPDFKISFLKNPPDGYHSWREVKLFPKAYSTTYDSMKESMTRADVPPWLKVTHLRKFGIAHLTAQGLTEGEVTTMTKHRDNNFSRSYRSEMCKQIACTLAGFLPKEPDDDKYFVPRAHICLPNNLDDDAEKFHELVSFLFPSWQVWRDELSSQRGDKEHKESAAHFLEVVIPWFTKVLMQDSVVWLETMPQNSALILFLSQMTTTQKGREFMGNQTFSQWAIEKKRDILFMVKSRKQAEEAKQLTNSNLVQTLIRHNESMLQAISRNHEDMMRVLRNRTVLMNPSNSTHVSHSQVTNDLNTPTVPVTINRTAIQTIHEALNNGNNAVVPIIWQVNKYKTVENLLGLRVSHRHDHVTTDLLRQRAPLYTQKDHWVKIKRIMKRVQDVMVEKGFDTLVAAARDVDMRERRGMSLNQYAEHLRTSDLYDGKYSGNHKRRRM